MNTNIETSDTQILDLLREHGPLSIAQLSENTKVTATAVRQRLTRLTANGLIERTIFRSGRGRPSHLYQLTEKGHRSAGTNYADLTLTLWQEIRAIKDPEVRRGLLARVAEKLAEKYSAEIEGNTLEEKMASLVLLMGERDVPFKLDDSGELPVLTAMACPYPELAQEDRSVCAMERMLFSKVLGDTVKLTDCRLDGAACCTFETV